MAGMPEDDPLERRRDRAGVGHVVAQVRAVVDARDDQVGLLAEEAEVGEADAVDRRPLGRKAPVSVVELDLLDPERRAGRDAPRRGRAVRVGRDQVHLHTVELAERAAERLDALGADSVVVGDQYPHRGRVYEPRLRRLRGQTPRRESDRLTPGVERVTPACGASSPAASDARGHVVGLRAVDLARGKLEHGQELLA